MYEAGHGTVLAGSFWLGTIFWRGTVVMFGTARHDLLGTALFLARHGTVRAGTVVMFGTARHV